MSDEVLYTTEDGVAVITINRPQARNAVNAAVARAVAEALDDLDARRDLSVGIITGAGGTFCAGMDLKAFMRGEVPHVEGRGFAGLVQRPPRKPLIAAVEGYALAGGFEVVLSSDLVVAAEDARFGIPEVKRGLVAGAGGLLRLHHRIPRNIAMELALTGDFVDAGRMAELGLVNRVTPSGGALEGARELAAAIAANAPLALAASKRVIVEADDWPGAERWERQSDIIGPIFASHDAMEGAAAFAEKRPPRWKGE
ncbi:crotonase/enoyl-CoA hydratase family protein [Marinactinospora thermotolerans]|uniref:Short chain enoyl-CoA hydratase n=1 Tax=Marinactinospora thermotolerans DSM 45154 TaxID=1122192 RepID=A0A1T4TFT4_9ACTN|nr:crotonase/enoyl-CoA hydratase family protein [Marinactinospora thermotolerans]SKA39310.1 short chain enoyl-CoA hydratase [Marinactinospora thermotolerans DSM 45154]